MPCVWDTHVALEPNKYDWDDVPRDTSLCLRRRLYLFPKEAPVTACDEANSSKSLASHGEVRGSSSIPSLPLFRFRFSNVREKVRFHIEDLAWPDHQDRKLISGVGCGDQGVSM